MSTRRCVKNDRFTFSPAEKPYNTHVVGEKLKACSCCRRCENTIIVIYICLRHIFQKPGSHALKHNTRTLIVAKTKLKETIIEITKSGVQTWRLIAILNILIAFPKFYKRAPLENKMKTLDRTGSIAQLPVRWSGHTGCCSKYENTSFSMKIQSDQTYARGKPWRLRNVISSHSKYCIFASHGIKVVFENAQKGMALGCALKYEIDQLQSNEECCSSWVCFLKRKSPIVSLLTSWVKRRAQPWTGVMQFGNQTCKRISAFSQDFSSPWFSICTKGDMESYQIAWWRTELRCTAFENVSHTLYK